LPFSVEAEATVIIFGAVCLGIVPATDADNGSRQIKTAVSIVFIGFSFLANLFGRSRGEAFSGAKV
jgi:hypothetical protein